MHKYVDKYINLFACLFIFFIIIVYFYLDLILFFFVLRTLINHSQ